MALEEGFKNTTQTNAGVIEDPRDHCGCQKCSQYGCFVLFDPPARNCNGFVDGTGTAIAMLFSTLDAMAHGWISKNIRKTQGL